MNQTVRRLYVYLIWLELRRLPQILFWLLLWLRGLRFTTVDSFSKKHKSY